MNASAKPENHQPWSLWDMINFKFRRPMRRLRW